MTQHTPLSRALVEAGFETPLFYKRGLFMSQPTFWLARLSQEKGGAHGVVRASKNIPVALPPRRFK